MARHQPICGLDRAEWGCIEPIEARCSGSETTDLGCRDLFLRNHVPIFASSTMASSARNENHAMFACPLMNSNASKGPMAEPAFPPTWNSDWAMPCCPPEAMRATREDSG